MGDSHHSPEEIKKHMKLYLAVFAGLLVGTLLTVWLYFIYFVDFWKTVAVALLVATVKATLVAAFFMHLSNEKKTIYRFLLVTVFFFAGMMGLTLWAFADHTMMR
jgi:cytochrome c oxidase subunit IV